MPDAILVTRVITITNINKVPGYLENSRDGKNGENRKKDMI